MSAFWISFAFTCGIFVGKVLPKLIEWVLNKVEARNIKDMEKSRRAMKNKDRKRVSEVGWMPFWWGSKFNKRLSSKRVRQSEKRKIKKESEDTE